MTGRTAEQPEAPVIRRLHLNESPLPPAPGVVAAIADAATRINRYPEPDSERLLDALAAYSGVSADRIIVTSGSNELLHLLPLIAGAHGAEMVVPDPSFPTYRKVAGFFDIKVHAVPVAADGRPDVDALLAAVTPGCRLVCVPSPNNPTGGLLEAEEIERLVAGVPDTMLLHFDEAYYEFGRQAGGVEALPLLEKRSGPWMTSRSFSKAFGLAGLRLGYTIACTAELAARARALRPNFSVNALAMAAGAAALDVPEHMQATVAQVSGERRRLSDGLAAAGLAPFPSAANFVAFPVPAGEGDLAARLASQGILTTAFNIPGHGAAIRITVGTSEDTDAVLAALSACRAG